MRARFASMLAVSLALALVGPAAAQRRPRETSPATPPIVITNGTLRPGNGPAIESATVIVRGDRVEAAGAGLAVPAGATVIDAQGGVITPGLVSTMTAIGLEEIELERASRDTGPEGDDADPIRAAFSAADGFNPLSSLLAVARLGGITSAMSVPEGGLVPGTSAWIDLVGPSAALRTDAVLQPALALHVSLNDEGIDAAGGARSAAILRLRELLDDAQLYARQRAAFDRGDFRDTDVSRLDLERVGEALAGRLPVVVKASRASDILRVIELGRQYGLRVVIAGAEEGWMVAAELAAANVPVIVQAMTNLPERFSRLHARYDNPALLARAGVRVILTSPGAWDVRNLRQEAGNAVAWGMDPDAALAAITSVPADVFGMREHGVIAAGRRANLVVWDADPFETTSAPTHVIVAGRDLPLRSRQTLLLERYRSLDRVPRGFATPRE